MNDFEGLVVLVTGGASGIGAASVAQFAARGAQVAVLDLDPSAVPAEVFGVACDVAGGVLGDGAGQAR